MRAAAIGPERPLAERAPRTPSSGAARPTGRAKAAELKFSLNEQSFLL
jgi:hypothetical protein